MDSRRSTAALSVVLGAWVLFGSWSLFRSEPGAVPGIESRVGHVVVFFFVTTSLLGLAAHLLGLRRGLVIGVVAVVGTAAVSEWLQPVLTDTRQAQRVDLVANMVGVGAAIVAITILAARTRGSDRLMRWLAVLGAVGLGGSALVTAVGVEQVQNAFVCRSRGYDRIESVAGGPVVVVDGSTVRLGSAAPQPLVDGVVTSTSADLRCDVIRSRGYTFVATVVPASIDSVGPTRILTSSAGTGFAEINAHIGQELDQLSIRTRTDDGLEWELIPAVFEAGRRVTIAVTVDDRDVVVYVDGSMYASFEQQPLAPGDWDPSFALLIGDEATGDRTFDGIVESVSIFDRVLAPRELSGA